MKIDPQLKEFAEGLSVMYVEDDFISASIMRKMLESVFSVVMGASNGMEALEVFKREKPDLIISDLMMPVMDGIGMLREIRKSDQKIPVIIMTASLEHIHLVEAINLGASRFLGKPFMPEDLHKALLHVTREIHLENVSELAKKQELELLKYRNRYHSKQQEMAQAKERHIVRNRISDTFLPEPDNGGWIVDLVQKPRDIMSGDSYSVKQGAGGRLLVFVADAMGHGLSASVTSMLATAFFNHAAKGCACSHLGFRHLAGSTMTFASRNLLEDEVFSGLVMELDPEKGKASVACCGMPPFLLVRNGQVERVKCLNPPVSAFSPPLKFQEVSLEGVSDILLSTDGLADAPLMDGGHYGERLAVDLLETATAAELLSRYNRYCNDDENDDDITAVRIARVGSWPDLEKFSYSCPGTLAGISALQGSVVKQLQESGASGERLDNLELALGEALLNAFEHGCLGLGAGKHRMILEGEYDDLLSGVLESPDKEITLSIKQARRKGRLQVWIEITDPGPGFDAESRFAIKTGVSATSGRGFMMMRRSVDIVRRNPAGNRLMLMQMFDI